MTAFDPPHYLLKWTDFQYSLLNALDSLRNEPSFIDVTLSCGGHKYGAHRVLLAASSPYFKDLFQDNVGSHPIIILRETSPKDLAAILEFMYNGQVNVPQEQVQSLLKTATDLQIKGLAQYQDAPGKKGPPALGPGGNGAGSLGPISQIPEMEPHEVNHEEVVMDFNEPKLEPDLTDPLPITVFPLHNKKNHTRPLRNNLTNPAHDGMTPSFPSSKGPGILACGYCGKTFKRRNGLLDHEHMHKGTTICHICQRVCSTRGNLKQHLLKKHNFTSP
ncbi:hypothetical protein TCAL_08408 [Tigriopus californicus]|uniref:BTB domain-containing protein n=1 Tax=Tigriopus californicus TaxID=6832 RepID=A0A553N939_TIGCA|nr:protein tramtrack, beta isoform-like [Tigriopus californicus]TRY61961.1 hypothetical protein TCAL_08408 [Tigriopus californicus]|eukprot:TCALIF_08408-PA protein Name:"Similar to lolal Longitudinals lacking protein-like (Drosophila melanogaster)" AED:0.00 eAED:0.00 QI:183/1/1/1/1/1/2/84/274